MLKIKDHFIKQPFSYLNKVTLFKETYNNGGRGATASYSEYWRFFPQV
jgi:hypothetical protein